MGYELKYTNEKFKVWNTIVDRYVSWNLNSPASVEKWFYNNVMEKSHRNSVFLMIGNKLSGIHLSDEPEKISIAKNERIVSKKEYAKAVGKLWRKEAERIKTEYKAEYETYVW